MKYLLNLINIGVLSTLTTPNQETVINEEELIEKPPPLYEVALLNDDYTPMEFVILVLQKFFKMDKEKATQIMLKVHQEGRGVCGVYSKDLAASKVKVVSNYSRSYQHPLQCIMEKA
jgi:ATP-dependent Clp protease adaptor protein ClpS